MVKTRLGFIAAIDFAVDWNDDGENVRCIMKNHTDIKIGSLLFLLFITASCGKEIDGADLFPTNLQFRVESVWADGKEVSEIPGGPVHEYDLLFRNGEAILSHRIGFETFCWKYEPLGEALVKMIPYDSLSTDCCGNIARQFSGNFVLIRGSDSGDSRHLFVGKNGSMILQRIQ